MKGYFARTRFNSSGVGVIKRAPAGPLDIATKPGQPTPPPHCAAARPSRTIFGSVARAREVDRREVLVDVQSQPVEHIAGEHHEARTARAPGDGLAPQVGDGPVR